MLYYYYYSTFTGDAVDVAELVTTATVALVGAVDVGALLAAGVGLALVHICQSINRSINRSFRIYTSKYLHVVYQ